MTINCGVDNEGYAVYGYPVDTSKSNAVTFRTVDTDSASATTTRTFKVVISGTALISNTNFGLGYLFPHE